MAHDITQEIHTKKLRGCMPTSIVKKGILAMLITGIVRQIKKLAQDLCERSLKIF